jgi:hypothetical protein
MYALYRLDCSDIPAGDAPHLSGRFATAELALVEARRIINDNLRESLAGSTSAADLLGRFMDWGEVVYIRGDPEVVWDSFEYATQSAQVIYGGN